MSSVLRCKALLLCLLVRDGVTGETIYNNSVTGTTACDGTFSSARLDIGFQKLTGTIPPELGNLIHLREIYLYNNTISGTIPQELHNIDGLKHL